MNKVLSPDRALSDPQPNIEIERKFLIKNLPETLDRYPSIEIAQGYITTEPEVRLRSKKGKDGNTHYFMTIKAPIAGSGGVKRIEEEIEIPENQFNRFWQFTAGRRVEKTRYAIPYGEHTLELDMYHGKLEGLRTVETEFTSEEASKKFTPPDWIGADITADKRFKNQNLALEGIPQAE